MRGFKYSKKELFGIFRSLTPCACDYEANERKL